MKNLINCVEEKHQLWLSWSKLVNAGGGAFKLEKAAFTGPVLLDTEPLLEKDYMDLDLTTNYIIIIPKPYIVRIAWDGIVKQTNQTIEFKEFYILDNELGHLNKLRDSDKILISCKGHHTDDKKSGRYTMYFESMVYNENNEPYDIN